MGRTRRRSQVAKLAVGTLAAGALVPLALAWGAVLSTSNFEIDTDANLVVNGGSPSIDWLAGGSGSGVRAGVTVKQDDPSGSADSAFSNGTKEDSAVPTLDNGGIPPNKSDLKQFGVFKETVGAKSYLHLFWSRVQDPSGTTNMDFEFNQSSVKVNNPAGSPQIVPVRTVGDLLLTYDLSNGGVNATMSKRTWTGSSWGTAVPLTGAQAIGTINSTAITAAQSGGLGPFSPRTFGEASIDLAAVLPTGQCTSFGSAYLKSRSSDSFTAALKDFVPPESVNVSNCGGVKIVKKDQNGAALAGAGFTLYKDNAPVGTARGAEDTVTTLTCTTPASGECTISNVPVGNYWVVETTVPANYNGAADQAVNVAAADTTYTMNVVNVLQTGSVQISKVDDATPAAPLQGAVFTLYVDNAPQGGTRGAEDTITTKTCTTAANGTCTISDVLLGRYWVVETTTPPNHATAPDQNTTLTTGGQTVGPLTFVDNRQFKVITIVCKVAGSTLYPSTVAYDAGSGQTTISAPPAGLTAAQLCGLGGATATVQKGGHSSSITIP